MSLNIGIISILIFNQKGHYIYEQSDISVSVVGQSVEILRKKKSMNNYRVTRKVPHRQSPPPLVRTSKRLILIDIGEGGCGRRAMMCLWYVWEGSERGLPNAAISVVVSPVPAL